MKIKELKELVKMFQEDKYDDYEVVFWDYARQKRMDGHFGGLSHPEKEISIPIADVGEESWVNPKNLGGIPAAVSSPFAEDAVADLEEKEMELAGNRFVAYHYRCRKTGKCFGTATSETFTMCNYYLEEVKRLRAELKKRDEFEESIV